MDFDDINPIGVGGAVLAFILAVIIAKKMGQSVPFRIIIGLVVGFINYFIASKIMDA